MASGSTTPGRSSDGSPRCTCVDHSQPTPPALVDLGENVDQLFARPPFRTHARARRLSNRVPASYRVAADGGANQLYDVKDDAAETRVRGFPCASCLVPCADLNTGRTRRQIAC